MNIELNGTIYTLDTKPITDGCDVKSFYAKDSFTTRFLVFPSGEVRFVAPFNVIRHEWLPATVVTTMQEVASLDRVALEAARRAS